MLSVRHRPSFERRSSANRLPLLLTAAGGPIIKKDMKHPLPFIAFVLLAFGSVMTFAEEKSPPATGFLFKTIRVDDRDYDYAVYLPRNYDGAKTWPMILFLHGMGESGTDGAQQLGVGLGTAIMRRPGEWPFVVILPQKPEARDAWEDHETAVMAMVRETEATFRIDPTRRYLTGLSQGGHGTMVLGARHSDIWAAIAPICGYVDPAEVADRLTEMPIWTFHGEADTVVPAEQSKAFVEAVRAAGGSAKLTLYPGVGHNSWDKAYREENLANWLLTHRKADPGE